MRAKTLSWLILAPAGVALVAALAGNDERNVELDGPGPNQEVRLNVAIGPPHTAAIDPGGGHDEELCSGIHKRRRNLR